MRNMAAAALLIFGAAGVNSASAQPRPFGIMPVADSSLAEITGTYAPTAFQRNARIVVEQNARSTFDTTATVGRVIFDNWFAREGAELLSAGVLGRPLVFD